MPSLQSVNYSISLVFFLINFYDSGFKISGFLAVKQGTSVSPLTPASNSRNCTRCLVDFTLDLTPGVSSLTPNTHTFTR